MRYFVSLDGREREILVDGSRVVVDGAEQEAHLIPIPGTPLRYLRLGDRSAVLAVQGRGQGGWSVGFQGDRWDLEVVDERARHIRGLTSRGAAKTAVGVLRAPMPGLVVRVQVSVGQRVANGTGIVVLEAMKMENELKAAGNSVVRVVRVEAGQPVEKGQVLVEFED